ncbi:MAG: hypothetical protein L0Y79_10445 [Chlorobi bacterium]|nr:hypothetical protein [Chlorobiota bacterium]MCI0715846.1 hypothetical protein [Chlorobiota bacterium]
MFKYFFVFLSLICLFISTEDNVYAQLGHNNIVLIANKNDHPPSGGSLILCSLGIQGTQWKGVRNSRMQKRNRIL